MRQVLAVLRTAHPVEHHLTIAEGLTAQQIAAVLARAEAMTGDGADDRGRLACCRRPTTTNTAPTVRALVARAKAAMDKDARRRLGGSRA